MAGDEFITFKLLGVEEMESLLAEIGPALAIKAGQKATNAGAKIVAKEAKQRVRKRTGKLARSITTQKAPPKMSEVATFVGFKPPESRRAHLEEFGTEKQAPAPFVRPAMDEKAGEVLEAEAEVLGVELEKITRELAKPIKGL